MRKPSERYHQRVSASSQTAGDGQERPAEIERLARRLESGDVRALARAISLVEDGGPQAAPLLLACRRLGAPRALRIGITGAAGAGKSTLSDQLVRRIRAEGKRVAVVAVDPTSPFTGGALLGDRIRMQDFAADSGVYIRSMATRGGLGGVAAGVEGVCQVLESARFGTILIETVGAGQDEISVNRLVDLTVLVLTPGMGDDVQSLKAGIMEAADLFVVNKADLDGADQVAAQVRAMQSLVSHAGEAWVPPVVRASALSGEGVPEVLEEIRRGCTELSGKRASPAVATARSEGRHASMQLDHFGIAVRSLSAAAGFYQALGLMIEGEEIVPHEGVRIAMLPLGETRLELLEPLSEDSVIGRFLAKRGEGLHHIAIRVNRLEERFAAMQESGVRLASDRVRTGAAGHRYFFVHPASTGGVLVELVEETA